MSLETEWRGGLLQNLLVGKQMPVAIRPGLEGCAAAGDLGTSKIVLHVARTPGLGFVPQQGLNLLPVLKVSQEVSSAFSA